MNLSSLKKWIGPLASRKVRVALATVISAYLVQYIPAATEDMVFTILGVGVAVILGIGVEDAGHNVAKTTLVQRQVQDENAEKRVQL